MNKRMLILLGLVILLCGCRQQAFAENWGSFTPDTTFSYDNQYYAKQTIEEVDGLSHIVISVYTVEGDLVDSFITVRAWDYWGICWEKDNYNIWVQSADIGVVCYRFDDGKWTYDPSAIRPEYIISKWDGKWNKPK